MKLYRALFHVDLDGYMKDVDVIVIAHTPEGAFDLAEAEVLAREVDYKHRLVRGAMSDVVEVILDAPRIVAYDE